MTGIKLENVSKSYGNTEVIHEMDLEINAGERVVFLGPSGSVSYTHLTLPTTRLVCRSRWSPYH